MHSGWFARNNVQRVTADLGLRDAKHEASRTSYGSGAAGARVPVEVDGASGSTWEGGGITNYTRGCVPPPSLPQCPGTVLDQCKPPKSARAAGTLRDCST